MTIGQHKRLGQANLATVRQAGIKEEGTATRGAAREREWLEGDAALAAMLSDADRIRILRDLLRTAAAIQRTKSVEDLRRDEEVRRALNEPGRARYRALAERLTTAA